MSTGHVVQVPERGPAPSAPPSALVRLLLQEDLNFLLTNRIPRRLATRFMGRFSRIRVGWIRDPSIALWRLFAADLDLSEARKSRFDSLHDCFIRELRDGARTIDPRPDVLISPCDAIVGAHGRIAGTELFQAKGFPYRLEDLLPDPALVAQHRDGLYVTLRLKSSFYHRFHAPCDAELNDVLYVSGDTWNVNPIALKRVERLFCRNERAVLDLRPELPGVAVTMVPVAAILVASLQLHAMTAPLDLRYRGPNRIPCRASYGKGQEMGYFQHGSTILLFASGDVGLHEDITEGTTIRMGQPLLRHLGTRSTPGGGSPGTPD